MLKLDTVRGADSTGVFTVSKGINKEVLYDKHLGTPYEFFKKSKYFGSKGTFLRTASVMIGHNRAATMGEVNADNAHPFDFENVIGVHNGTLMSRMLKHLDDHDKYDVDSEALYANINKHGLEKAISKTCGAYSLVMWDKELEELKLIRNDDRPMMYRYSEDGETLFFASEAWMIKVACQKKNVPLARNVYTTRVNQEYTVKPDDITEEGHLRFTYNPKKFLGKAADKLPASSYPAGHGYYMGYDYDYESSFDWEEYDKGRLERLDRAAGRSQSSLALAPPKKEVKEMCGYYPLKGQTDDDVEYITLHSVEETEEIRVIIPPLVGENNEIRQEITNGKVDSWYTVEAILTKTQGRYIWCANVGTLRGPFPFSEYEWPIMFPAEGEGEVIDEKGNLVNIPLIGFNGVHLTKKKFDKLIGDGCAFCGSNDTKVSDHHNVKWVEHDVYLCPDCSENPNANLLLH